MLICDVIVWLCEVWGDVLLMAEVCYGGEDVDEWWEWDVCMSVSYCYQEKRVVSMKMENCRIEGRGVVISSTYVVG